MTFHHRQEIKKILYGLIEGNYYLLRYRYNIPLELPIERLMTLHRVSIQEDSLFIFGQSNPSEDKTYTELSVYEITPIVNKTRISIPIIEEVKIEIDTITKEELLEELIPIIDSKGKQFIRFNYEPFSLGNVVPN